MPIICYRPRDIASLNPERFIGKAQRVVDHRAKA